MAWQSVEERDIVDQSLDLNERKGYTINRLWVGEFELKVSLDATSFQPNSVSQRVH